MQRNHKLIRISIISLRTFLLLIRILYVGMWRMEFVIRVEGTAIKYRKKSNKDWAPKLHIQVDERTPDYSGSIQKYYCGAGNSYSSLDTLPSRRRKQCASPSLLSESPNHFQPKMKTTKITHSRRRGNVENGNSFEFCSFAWSTGFAEFKLGVHNGSAHAEYQNSVYLFFWLFHFFAGTHQLLHLFIQFIAQSTSTHFNSHTKERTRQTLPNFFFQNPSKQRTFGKRRSKWNGSMALLSAQRRWE